MSILAISNAKARAVSKQGSRINLAALPEGSHHHMSENKADLPVLLTEASKQHITHLVIEGGDGTVRSVMTALLNSYGDEKPLPAVSILPSGTTNQIARNLGLKSLSDLKSIRNGDVKATTTPLVRISVKDDIDGLDNPLFGFLFSTGALPHVSRFAQEKLNSNGVGGGTAVVGAVIKAVTGNKDELMPPAKHKMCARLNDRIIFKHKGIALGSIMTTLPTLMMGLDPFWGTETGPLRLTWAEAESQKLGRTVAGLWVGRKPNRTHDGFHSHNIDHLKLRTKAPATLDGDFLDIQNKRLRISASRPVTFWQAS